VSVGLIDEAYLQGGGLHNDLLYVKMQEKSLSLNVSAAQVVLFLRWLVS
jgi:hypothetical protein